MMESIENRLELDKKPRNTGLGVRKLLKRTAGAVVVLAVGGLIYQCCFKHRVIEDVTVVDKGSYSMYDAVWSDAIYFTTITIDKNDKCFIVGRRDGEKLMKGDKLKFVEYEPSIRLYCDHLEDYEFE